MSCASGSNGAITGAKAAVRSTTATTSIPNSAVRRRMRRRSSTIPSRSLSGRGGAKTTDSVATDGDVTGASPESDPRVEIRVDDVHEKVDDHEGAGEDEYGRLHHRVVAVEDGLHGEPADTGPGEDGF